MRKPLFLILCLVGSTFNLAWGQMTGFAQNFGSADKNRQSTGSKNETLREDEILKKFQTNQRSPDEQLRYNLINRLQKNAILRRKGGNVSGGGDDHIAFDGTADEAKVIKSYQRKLLGLEQSPVAVSDKKIRIAILDSGISADSAIASMVQKFVDFTSKCSGQTFCDDSSHGSLVADLVSQTAPDHSLIILKTLSEGASGQFQHLLSALQWLLKNHQTLNIGVVNLSLTSPEKISGTWNEVDQARELVKKLDDEGVIVVSAVGNDFQNKISLFPASSPHVLAVGSYDHSFSQNPVDFQVSLFSNAGYAENPKIEHSQFLGVQSTFRDFSSWVYRPDVLAPGENVLACSSSKSCSFVSGTSFAAALVAGGIASLLEKEPTVTRDAIMIKIKSSPCQRPFIQGNWDQSRACGLRLDLL